MYQNKERGIEALHKNIIYKTISSQKEFNEAIELLSQTKYHSFQAEKKRRVYKKFSTKIYKSKEEVYEKFKTLSLSFINMFEKIENYDDFKNTPFLKTKDNLIKIELIDGDMFFRTTYIINDTIYIDEFYIYKHKHYYKLNVKKIINLPITRDPMSQYTYFSAWDMNKKFKTYKTQILKGIHLT